MSKLMINADTMLNKVRKAAEDPKGKGLVECLIHFARLADNLETSEFIDDILDVDLDDCTPKYAKAFRRTWEKLDRALTEIVEDA